jgi:PIN domain nuclease of toxin-antitoxin system
MIAAIADTHAAIWFVYGDRRLSTVARQFMEESLARGQKIGISSITLLEIVYLEEKRRIPSGTLHRFLNLLGEHEGPFQELPLQSGILPDFRRIAREAVPDMPDRVVGATALSLGIPVLTKDRQIEAAGLDTIW